MASICCTEGRGVEVDAAIPTEAWAANTSKTEDQSCRPATLHCTVRRLSRRRLRDSREAGFDRLPHFLVELTGILALRFDRLADHDPDRARFLQEPAPWPEGARVMRQRHHTFARGDREQRAAHAELAGFTCDHPRAFRKDDDPQAVLEPLLALINHLIDRPVALSAIDGDRP